MPAHFCLVQISEFLLQQLIMQTIGDRAFNVCQSYLVSSVTDAILIRKNELMR